MKKRNESCFIIKQEISINFSFFVALHFSIPPPCLSPCTKQMSKTAPADKSIYMYINNYDDSLFCVIYVKYLLIILLYVY